MGLSQQTNEEREIPPLGTSGPPASKEVVSNYDIGKKFLQ